MRRWRPCTTVLALLGILAASRAHAQRISEIYLPHARIAEELVPLARAAMGKEGQAILDSQSNSVVLIGQRKVVDETLELLRRQDHRVPLLRLHYQSYELSKLAQSGLEISWQAGIGVGVGRVLGPGSGRGIGRLYRTGESRSFGGELSIKSGSTGHVGRGRSVPLVGRDLQGRFVTGAARAERGFRATPHLLGDGRIQLEFTNTEATVDDAGRIVFQDATTTLVVEPGETVAVGSLVETSQAERGHGKSYSTRVSTQAGEERRVFLLTLEIENP